MSWLKKYDKGGFLQPNDKKLPKGTRIPEPIHTELASSIGGENGEPAYLIPTFKYGKYLENPIEEFKKTGEHLGGPFKTWQEADKWEREVRHPYVEKGLSIPMNFLGWGQKYPNGGKIIKTTTESSKYDPRTDYIYINPNEGQESNILKHESFHRKQHEEEKDIIREWMVLPYKKPNVVATDDYWRNYYNRGDVDNTIISNKFLEKYPEFTQIPQQLIYYKHSSAAQYELPWTMEGEARENEKYPDGGNVAPFITSDINEYKKRKQAYEDSLGLYNLSNKLIRGKYGYPEDYSFPANPKYGRDKKGAMLDYLIKYNSKGINPNTGQSLGKGKFKEEVLKSLKRKIKPLGYVYDDFAVPVYKKPVQQVLYKEKENLNQIPTYNNYSINPKLTNKIIIPQQDYFIPQPSGAPVYTQFPNGRLIGYNTSLLPSQIGSYTPEEINKLKQQGIFQEYKDGGNVRDNTFLERPIINKTKEQFKKEAEQYAFNQRVLRDAYPNKFFTSTSNPIETIEKNLPYTLPNGQRKTFDKMNWREKNYVRGNALKQRGKINKLPDALNPVQWVGDIAGNLAQAPYEAQQSNSILPYLTAIATPLVMGRSMGSGNINPISKKFWTNEVSNAEFLNNMALGVPNLTKNAIKNIYKINPWAFKPNPEASYRMLGTEGYADALKSGVIRSKPSGFYDQPYFSKGEILDTYGGPYMAEIQGHPMVKNNMAFYSPHSDVVIPRRQITIENPGLKFYKQDWLRGYKEVPKPITETLPPPQQAGFPNPLAIADAIVPRINPFSFIKDGGDLMSMSPLNFVPGYGKNLSGKNQAFRKFGNSIQDVIERQALSPKGGSPLRIGKNQIVSEGNWAATGNPWEKYPGVFEATFDFTHPERNIGMQGFKNRSGVLITDRQGNPLPEIPLTEPGMSFNRRLPFSTRYVPIDKQKLIDNKFQLATFAPHLQSLAEKYAVGLGGAATLAAIGYPDAVETYNKYTIDPIKNWTKEKWEDYQKSDVYKKFREIDKSVGLDFLYDQKKKGGVVKDNRGQWAHPGKPTRISSPNITMEGVPYPVLAKVNNGMTTMMYPKQDYYFPGANYVDEYPMMQNGGNISDNTFVKKPIINKNLNSEQPGKPWFKVNIKDPGSFRKYNPNDVIPVPTVKGLGPVQNSDLKHAEDLFNIAFMADMFPNNFSTKGLKNIFKKPINYIESNVPPPVESSVGPAIKRAKPPVNANPLPYYSQIPNRELPEHLKPYLTGSLEPEYLNKEQQILQSFGLNPYNPGKKEMGGIISSRTNSNWLDKYNDSH